MEISAKAGDTSFFNALLHVPYARIRPISENGMKLPQSAIPVPGRVVQSLLKHWLGAYFSCDWCWCLSPLSGFVAQTNIASSPQFEQT